MKKTISLVLAAVLLCALVLTGCSVEGNQTGSIFQWRPGKNTPAPTATPTAEPSELPALGGETKGGELDEETLAIFQAAVADTEYASYTAEALLSTQLVAGKNYTFLCSDEGGAKFTVTVYRDLSGNCSVTDVSPYTEG